MTLTTVFFYLDRRQKAIYMDFMKNQSRSVFKQIVLTRMWIADHGGVFVEKLPWLNPNPYLDNGTVMDAGGRELIRENPAMVTRELSEYAREHGSYWFHITSLKLVNPANAPDEFEADALRKFESRNLKEAWAVKYIEGERYFRYIAPLYVEKECLTCHRKHGYKLGDVRGAISVSIPVESFYIFLKRERVVMALFTLSVALLLMFGLYVTLNRVLVLPIKRLRDFALAWRKGTLPATVPGTESPLIPGFVPEQDELGDLYAELSSLHKTVTSNERELEYRVQKATEELKSMNAKLALARDRYKDTSLKKSDFIAGLSHELRTPLTSVRGAIGYITGRVQEGKLDPDEMEPFIDIINRNISRLVKLVEDTLDLEKIEAGYIELHHSKVDITTLFNEVIEEFSPQAEERNVEFKVDTVGPCMTMVDRDRIRQVLDNLVINAIKHSPPGTSITLGERTTPGQLTVCVTDQGPGIPPEMQRRIFDRFYKGSKEGTGLGLTISRGIVEAHGGDIWVESEGMSGASFCFTLSLEEDETAAAETMKGTT